MRGVKPEPRTRMQARAGGAGGGDRGAATREALIDAAIALIGERGYANTSTRDIAHASGQNLAAIAYHFGSKEKLYHAIVERHLANVHAGIGERLIDIRTLLAHGPLKPARATALLVELMGAIAQHLLREENRPMSLVLLREQLDPTAAFETLYANGLRHVFAAITGLLDAIVDRRVTTLERGLLAQSILGCALAFRVGHGSLLKQTRWTKIGERERQAIAAAVRMHVHALLVGLRAERGARSASNESMP